MSGPYSVTLADLIDMADAAAELDGLQFAFVDQPDEQARLRMRARKLHDMVERAAGEDYARVGAACNAKVSEGENGK